MKAFVLAEHSDAAQELCAGARTMADEVVLVAIADMEVPAAVADKVIVHTGDKGREHIFTGNVLEHRHALGQ